MQATACGLSMGVETENMQALGHQKGNTVFSLSTTVGAINMWHHSTTLHPCLPGCMHGFIWVGHQHYHPHAQTQ